MKYIIKLCNPAYVFVGAVYTRCVYVCVCMYVCVYICMYICVFVCTCISVYVCVYLCVSVCVFVCIAYLEEKKSPQSSLDVNTACC